MRKLRIKTLNALDASKQASRRADIKTRFLQNPQSVSDRELQELGSRKIEKLRVQHAESLIKTLGLDRS